MNHRYKLRAEAWIDLVNLAEALMPQGAPPVRCTSFTIEATGIGPDPIFEMAVTSSLALDDLLAIIDDIEDGHVMYETIQPIEHYTGERDYDRP
jgi:hypothetical protein